MSFLFNTVFAWKCTSTHHKMAMDSLQRLHGPNVERWRNLFLKYSNSYLKGATAPDIAFGDYRNHILHVHENFWGGAVKTAQRWYEHTVAALKQNDWPEAIYSAGVLSHYYTDPIMPLHTARQERQGNIHRAAERSIFKSYAELRSIIEEDLGGWPKLNMPDGLDWLAQMIRRGAEYSNQYYELFLDHYNLQAGVEDPTTGLDQELKDSLAQLIGRAVVGFARILERAFADAHVSPPKANLQVQTVCKTLSIPVCWLTTKFADAKERAAIDAIYQEVRKTGKVITNLPESEITVRKLHAKEVLKKSLGELDRQKPKPTGAKHGTGAPPRSRQPGRQRTSHPPKKQYVLSRMPIAAPGDNGKKRAA